LWSASKAIARGGLVRYAQHVYTAKKDETVDEFVCVTVRSAPGENTADFAARLSRFWTHMLRTQIAEFAKVYAETTKFELSAGRHTRRYAVEESVVETLESEFAKANLEHEPIDLNEVYSKYETVAPEWMQIEH
jgi:hypothetical protein